MNGLRYWPQTREVFDNRSRARNLSTLGATRVEKSYRTRCNISNRSALRYQYEGFPSFVPLRPSGSELRRSTDLLTREYWRDCD